MADDRFLQRVAAETGLVRNADPVPETVVAEIVARDYDLRGALTRIATEKDDTFRLDTDDRSYLVKISSASEDPAIVDGCGSSGVTVPMGGRDLGDGSCVRLGRVWV